MCWFSWYCSSRHLGEKNLDLAHTWMSHTRITSIFKWRCSKFTELIIYQAEEEMMLCKGDYSGHLVRDVIKPVLPGNLLPGLIHQIISPL
jgi:hypothetical protein